MVDYEIPVGRLKEKQILQVGQWEDIWGNTLKEPIFAITDIVIDVSAIQLLGDKRNLIKFEKIVGKNKITFIKTFSGEATYNMLTMKNHTGLSKKANTKVKIDVIGRFAVNKWNSCEFPQIEILDFNVESCKEFRF